MSSQTKNLSNRNLAHFNNLHLPALFILLALGMAGWLQSPGTVQAYALDGLESQNASIAQAANSTLTIARPAVNLRAGPGTNYAIVTVGKEGEIYAITGTNQARNWYQIALSDGRSAWIYAPLVVTSGDVSVLPVVENPAVTGVAAPSATTATTPLTTTAQTATAAASASAATAATTIRAGAMSGRLLYSIANMDAKRWELWEYNFATAANTKVSDWRTEIDASKDGKQIAYFAWPPSVGDKAGIWIMDADFANTRLVVPGGAYPSFSPGGDRLVVNGGDNLYVLKTDGTGVRGLTNGEYPAWSPVSNQIVHRACVGGSCGLWLIDADSTNPAARTHITTGGSDGQPAWSPDGKRIAYISKEDGNFEIYVIGSDGSNKVRVTSEPASDGLPVWSPDGQWLAFRSDRDGKWAIYVTRADGSHVQKVIDADVLPFWFFEKMDWR